MCSLVMNAAVELDSEFKFLVFVLLRFTLLVAPLFVLLVVVIVVVFVVIVPC
jgi:hypothetical protein